MNAFSYVVLIFAQWKCAGGHLSLYEGWVKHGEFFITSALRQEMLASEKLERASGLAVIPEVAPGAVGSSKPQGLTADEIHNNALLQRAASQTSQR